jgi:MFS family permease
MTPDRSCKRFGPVWLAPGISLGNAWAFMFASFIGIGFLTFVNFGQAYILNEHLKIPPSEQGAITGNLAFVTEIVVLTVVGGFGVAADRIGRRPILALGLFAMAVSYIFYPLAGSVTDLTVYRMIYAAGMAACTGMLGTIVNDYPQDISRGKMIALGGVFNALGIVFVNGGLGQAPDFFVARGFDGIMAGRYTHWIVAAILVPSAVLLLFTLKGGTPVRREDRPPVYLLIKSGLREARNPRIALAYLSAFVARSDLVVLGTFLVLWGTLAGIDQGLSTAQAIKRATLLFVIAQGAGLLWMPVMGWIIDRVDRVTALAIGTFLAAIGFSSMGLIDNPLDPGVLHLFVLVGVGQVSCFFASQALIGQEAPLEKRGSVIGMFSFCGAAGILIATLVGGQLFDAWLRPGPFVLVGAANVVIFLLAILVRFRHGSIAGTVRT